MLPTRSHAPTRARPRRPQGVPYLLADPSPELAAARLARSPRGARAAEVSRRLRLYRQMQPEVLASAARVVQAAWRAWVVRQQRPGGASGSGDGGGDEGGGGQEAAAAGGDGDEGAQLAWEGDQEEAAAAVQGSEEAAAADDDAC